MIGKEVACRAQGLGMRVLAWSRSLTEAAAEELGVEYCTSPLEIARRSDAVTLHVAAAAETNRLVNKEFLDALPNGAILINTSRGEVIDQTALAEAIQRKNLRVGLDVFADEPKPGEAPFADTELAKLVTATPHIGASTDEASEAIAEESVRIIRLFRDAGGRVDRVELLEVASGDTGVSL
jgi:D-3-phosphoglycerate dehydrogenase